MARPKAIRGSILRRQSPARKRRRELWLPSRFTIYAISIVAMLICIVLAGHSLSSLAEIKKDELSISVDLVADNLTNRTRMIESVKQFIRDYFKASKTQSLVTLSDKLAKRFHPEDIRTILISSDHLYVQIKLREPMMILQLSEPKFISDKGDIFGDASKALSSKKLRTLTGLSLRPELNHQDSTGRLALNEQQQHLVNQALKLNQLLDHLSIEYSDIIIVKHRGFLLKGNAQNPDMMLGFDDFAKRLERALTVIKKLKKEQKIASSIEVDFASKSFVKERVGTEK